MEPPAIAAASSAAPGWQPRTFCWRCAKPGDACVCASVPRVENRTEVVVLQHPRERFHPIGTVRFVELGLARARVEVARAGGFTRRPPWIGPRAALLYPAPGAVELAQLSPAARPDQLVVLDGTWHHAKTLHRDLAWLRELPALRLAPTTPSRYRLRREPTPEAISTVEAVVEALRLLEPETGGTEQLLGAFDRMIDQQIEHVRRGGGGRRVERSRPRPWRSYPRGLVEEWDALVIVYAEGLRGVRAGARAARWPVHVVAHRPATGATFESLVRVPGDCLEGPALRHARLAPEEVALAPDAVAAVAAFERFLPSGAVVAAWNATTLDLVLPGGRERRGVLVLKSAYGSATAQAAGVLEEATAALGLIPPELPVRGRARERLAAAVAMAAWLRARALGEARPRPPM
ncbi:MAG: DTW domain-containing protein [Polyangiaceae bacterium]|nr:DTW domain-containing protein [Polyangiaceae bacterium]